MRSINLRPRSIPRLPVVLGQCERPRHNTRGSFTCPTNGVRPPPFRIVVDVRQPDNDIMLIKTATPGSIQFGAFYAPQRKFFRAAFVLYRSDGLVRGATSIAGRAAARATKNRAPTVGRSGPVAATRWRTGWAAARPSAGGPRRGFFCGGPRNSPARVGVSTPKYLLQGRSGLVNWSYCGDMSADPCSHPPSGAGMRVGGWSGRGIRPGTD